MNTMNADVGCQLVAEYVDEANPSAPGAVGRGEAVRANVVGNYFDLWSPNGLQEFTVLLKDGRVASVRGQSLRILPNPGTGEGPLYGIITRTAAEEAIVALFKGSEVVGIFQGELSPDRKSA